MKVRNRRDRDVVIADPEFPRISVAGGGVVDVPERLARSLLEQPDRWEASETPDKAAPSGKQKE